jgi:hypothetical protein
MRKTTVALLVTALLTGLACEEGGSDGRGEKVEQGTVQSRKCPVSVGGGCKIKVKYKDGDVKTYEERKQKSKKCTKGAKYPACVGIKYITDY